MSFLLTPPNKVHGLQPDCAFTVPPLDGSLTLPEIYDWHYENNPQHPVFLYTRSTGEKCFCPYSEVVPAAHRAGRYVADAAGIDLTADASTFPLVAIFAATDTVTYFTTLIGALRAGIRVLNISPRFSAEVIAHLLSTTKATRVFVGTESTLNGLLQDALNVLKKTQGANVPGLSPMPTFGDIYVSDGIFKRLPVQKQDFSAPTIIVHSSGSSGAYPKPIVWNARSQLQSCMLPQYGVHDLCGQIFAYHAMELFHASGLFFLSWLPSAGFILGTFAPATPATCPTAESVFSEVEKIQPSYMFAPPALISKWSQDDEKVALLSKLRGLMYGGRFINKSVGDSLVSQGVKVYTLYGLTETGLVSPLLSECQGVDWEYFSVTPHCAAKFMPTGDDTYELVVVQESYQELTLTNTEVDGKNAYATGDILVPHPTKPGLWKVLGRINDQIMLTTGDVLNPYYLEDTLCQHPDISAAVMFGRGKNCVGVLIELKEELKFDFADTAKRMQRLGDIWPKIAEANATAPKFAQLSKETVLFSEPARPFTYNMKGVAKRPLILQQYQPEIDALYRALAGRGQRYIAPIVAL
ncbi:acetyl-CoA synthetase-like protein [Leucogyrophana mollusca]|uniref:Acetyl-CoA synthetase-like protein n=1 Tax=Leucogyrophana mollusca TaxID=85980 RepID=A0ACB8BKW6_9AGAM|nr:acetyl-CoA synthetase-like protein [Leucogyrophana mollusca]